MERTSLDWGDHKCRISWSADTRIVTLNYSVIGDEGIVS